MAGWRTALVERDDIDPRDAQGDALVSRARPMFLYVVYAMILWALPMGFLAAAAPKFAAAMTRGIGAYLAVIPDALWTLFGTGYLGYTVARTWGKVKGATE